MLPDTGYRTGQLSATTVINVDHLIGDDAEGISNNVIACGAHCHAESAACTDEHSVFQRTSTNFIMHSAVQGY